MRSCSLRKSLRTVLVSTPHCDQCDRSDRRGSDRDPTLFNTEGRRELGDESDTVVRFRSSKREIGQGAEYRSARRSANMGPLAPGCSTSNGSPRGSRRPSIVSLGTVGRPRRAPRRASWTRRGADARGQLANNKTWPGGCGRGDRGGARGRGGRGRCRRGSLTTSTKIPPPRRRCRSRRQRGRAPGRPMVE